MLIRNNDYPPCFLWKLSFKFLPIGICKWTRFANSVNFNASAVMCNWTGVGNSGGCEEHHFPVVEMRRRYHSLQIGICSLRYGLPIYWPIIIRSIHGAAHIHPWSWCLMCLSMDSNLWFSNLAVTPDVKARTRTFLALAVWANARISIVCVCCLGKCGKKNISVFIKLHSSEDVRNEVDLWSRLEPPLNLMQFSGALLTFSETDSCLTRQLRVRVDVAGGYSSNFRARPQFSIDWRVDCDDARMVIRQYGGIFFDWLRGRSSGGSGLLAAVAVAPQLQNCWLPLFRTLSIRFHWLFKEDRVRWWNVQDAILLACRYCLIYCHQFVHHL